MRGYFLMSAGVQMHPPRRSSYGSCAHFKCKILSMLCSLLLTGCGSHFLPAGSPTVREISLSEDQRKSLGFEYFEVDEKIANVLAQTDDLTFSKTFARRASAPASVIGPGDVLQISVWEPGGSGLFGPAISAAPGSGGAASGARSAALQPIVVERDGQVTIPFSGRVHVGGLRVEAARARIERALRANAIQPQVLLSIVSQNSHTANVGGEVGKPGLVPLSSRGDTRCLTSSPTPAARNFHPTRRLFVFIASAKPRRRR